MVGRRFALLLFLVLASTIINAQPTPAQSQLFQQLPLALPLVIVIMVAILSVSYMMSEAFHAPQLKAWVKTEIRELIAAGILLAVVLTLLASANTWIGLLTDTPNYQAAAKTTLTDMRMRAVTAYNDLIKAYYLIGMRTGFSATLSGGYVIMLTASNAPFTGYAPFFTFMGQAAGGLTGIIFLYRALEVFLDFFARIGGTLIYVAFAFRFIPFTRNVGSTLVALIIGLYLIFPLSLVIVNYMHTNILSASAGDIPTPQISPVAFAKMEFPIPPGARYMCGQGSEGTAMRLMIATFGEIFFALPPCILVAIATALFGGAGFQPCYALLAYVVYPILTTVILPVTWTAIVGPSIWASIDLQPVYDALQPFFQQVNSLVVLSYVDAIVATLITMAGIRSLSLALGGEYLIPGVQRLI